jgi:hypothetical protein
MRRIDSEQARRFLEEHRLADNKVDPTLIEAIAHGRELYLLRLEDQVSFLSLVWYQAPAVRLLVPDGEPRTLRDVAQRLIQRGHSFQALCNNSALPSGEFEPGFFKPCLEIDVGFDFRRFGWIAVVAAADEERAQSPLGSFYIYDGLHKSLVLAKRLLAGETTYQPVEALYLVPRP